MAGVVASNDRYRRLPKKPDSVEDMYKLYEESVKKQAGDYDSIMGKFNEIYGGAGANSAAYTPQRVNFNPVHASQTTYNKSPDTTAALADLHDLAETGGLSESDQQNLRARGVSPIRAQYATAQRDMDRQRRLNGGYSPNFGAVTSRMARDQSSLIADQMDKVNANIAEMVQSGRLNAAPNYASAAQAESSLAHGIAEHNTAARNETSRFNASGMFDAARTNAGNAMTANASRSSDRLGAVSGMTSLYGTTPALANLYGNQADRSYQNSVASRQRRRSGGVAAFGAMYGR